MDRVGGVGSDKSEPSKGSTVNDPDGRVVSKKSIVSANQSILIGKDLVQSEC